MILKAFILMLFVPSLSPSPGPGCFRAQRTERQQNDIREKQISDWPRAEENDTGVEFVNKERQQEQRTISQTTLQHPTLYLRCLYFRKTTGWTTARQRSKQIQHWNRGRPEKRNPKENAAALWTRSDWTYLSDWSSAMWTALKKQKRVSDTVRLRAKNSEAIVPPAQVKISHRMQTLVGRPRMILTAYEAVEDHNGNKFQTLLCDILDDFIHVRVRLLSLFVLFLNGQNGLINKLN